jgi:putative flavoprotein involved in K+ transport
MSGREVEVAIVGAGAAGLGAAAQLQRVGVRGVVVLERADAVATSWRARYDGLQLNTVRRLSGLPGHPIPAAAGTWPSRESFIEYLEHLADGFDLHLGVEVRRIERTASQWSLDTSAGRWQARFVVVATGYDRVPKIPDWPGVDSFSGELLHASAFRNATPYRDRDVLVVGAGNTGSEVATRLVNGGAARVRVSVRTPVNIMPPRFLGIPTPVLARASEAQPAWLVDRMSYLMQRIAWGDLTPYGMPRSPFGVATELTVRGLGPTLDRGFVAALKSRRLTLVPAVERFGGPDVMLAGEEAIQPEVVIAATGYRHGLGPLVGHLGVLLESGRPAERTGGAHPAAPGLYFNGYWLPLSGQLPAMRRTSRRVARAIAGASPAIPRKRERPRVRGLSRSRSSASRV